MSPDIKVQLRKLLVLHESCKLFPYTDTTGNLTIGIGRNLTTRGISTNEAYEMLDDDIAYFTDKLQNNTEFFNTLDDIRQAAIVDMCFNLGINGFLEFKEMLSALESRDYNKAATEMLNSKWAHQVGERATCLATIIQTGKLQ